MAFSENSVIKISELRDAIYPIGSVYLSVNNVSPQTFFGGTWIALEEGRTLWTADPSKDDNGNTISEGTNNLSDNESTWKIEAGLPNIKGGGRTDVSGGRILTNAVTTWGEGNNYFTGAFKGYSYTDQRLPATTNVASHMFSYVNFDASRCSTIYKDSCTTVQPPALRIYAWRRTA